MSKYEIEVTLKVNEELEVLTGFVKGSDVVLVCDFDYWDHPGTSDAPPAMGFEFHSVHFYGMNPNGVQMRICSDELYALIEEACKEKIKLMEIAAYEAYIKECG